MAEEPKTVDIKYMLHFKTGNIALPVLETILNTIPFELGFCDENDEFQWFTDNGHRVYKRSKETFGKNVLGLHHGGARPQVQELLKQFHAGTKDNFEFLLDLDGRKIYISFYAVHDENGKYLGCFDFTGDITELQQMKETAKVIPPMDAIKAKEAAEKSTDKD